jgi:hypothetical protein
MIACRQVAKALANHRYYELPWHRRIPMFIHIRLCIMCGKYHQQVVDMKKGVRDYLEHENDGYIEPDVHLSREAKARIAAELNKQK